MFYIVINTKNQTVLYNMLHTLSMLTSLWMMLAFLAKSNSTLSGGRKKLVLMLLYPAMLEIAWDFLAKVTDIISSGVWYLVFIFS